MKKKQYNFLSKKLISSNSRFKIYFDSLKIKNKLINNFLMIRPIIKKKDKVVGICVIPEVKKKFGIMQVWRHQFNQHIWQAPTGFAEKNEKLETTAIKELLEETGLKCEKKNLKYLGKIIPDAGLIEGKIIMYLALKCKKITHKIVPEIGANKIHFFKRLQIYKMLNSNQIISASSHVALSKAIKFNA